MDFLKKTIGKGLNFLKQSVGVGGTPPMQSVTGGQSKDDLEAVLSDQAYNPNYDQVDQALAGKGYKVDRELSGKNHTTYTNGKKAKIAYRGTVPTNKEDLEADAHIAVGSRKHARFDEAVATAKKVQKKYGNVDVTGHSLGGTQALYVNNQLGLKAKAYNPGSSLITGKNDIYNNDNATVVRHADDIISKGARSKNTITYNNDKTGVKKLGVLGKIYNAYKSHGIF